MSVFEYAAVDAQGRTQRGAIEANGPREVRELLRQRHLVPIEIQAARATANAPSRWQRFGKRELALFTRQLATLVEATPLEEALRTIGTQSDHRGMRRTVMAVHGLLLEGFRLSDAMGRQGKAFPPLYRAMVAAGEGSGALPEILERLSGLLEAERQASSKLLTALAYPAALAITAVGVVLALMAFVVPKVVEQFDSMGRTLPWLTRAVITLSEALVNWGLPMLLLAAAGGFALRLALERPKHRLRFDAALLRTPLVGRLIRDTHAAQMARTLSIMVGSGLPLMEGLQITAPTVHNRVLREATESMATAIREGGSLSGAMRRAGVFPPTLVYMATSGENSGRLAPMLDRAADYLDREFATYTAVLMSLLEPLIIVVLGGVVALIVLSILLPILQFNSLAFAS